jgi:hypothetical protein
MPEKGKTLTHIEYERIWAMAPQSTHVGNAIGEMGIDYSNVNSMDWGYSIQGWRGHMVARFMILELLCMIAGALLLICSAGMWAFGGLAASVTVLGMKFTLSIAMLLASLALLDLSRRGLRREVHIDEKRKEVRVVWRNWRDSTQLDSVLSFSEISSIFVRRRKMPLDLAVLYLRFGPANEVIEINSGEEGSMRALWEKLNIDLFRAHPDKRSSVRPQGRRATFKNVNGPQPMRRRNAVSTSISGRSF